MAGKMAKAGSQLELPLFENPPVPVKDPEQILMLEVFSELAKQKKTPAGKYGIDLMPWHRRQAVTRAGSFLPERSSGAVLELFYHYTGGDCREPVLDHFLGMFLRRAEDRPAKLDRFLADIKKHVMAKAELPAKVNVVSKGS